MTERKEAIAASLVIVAMLSVALITVANAYYRPALGENNEYQFPWGTIKVKIVSSNVIRGWYNATLTLSNGTTWIHVFPVGGWSPTEDWLQRADLPWIIYIPPTGSPNFVLDFSGYLQPFAIKINLTHVGYTYVCHIGSLIPDNLIIKWDDRSGILTEVDYGNSALVHLVAPNL
jgi:hypothetical protein